MDRDPSGDSSSNGRLRHVLVCELHTDCSESELAIALTRLIEIPDVIRIDIDRTVGSRDDQFSMIVDTTSARGWHRFCETSESSPVFAVETELS